METLRQDFALPVVFCQIFSLRSFVLVQQNFLAAKGYRKHWCSLAVKGQNGTGIPTFINRLFRFLHKKKQKFKCT